MSIELTQQMLEICSNAWRLALTGLRLALDTYPFMFDIAIGEIDFISFNENDRSIGRHVQGYLLRVCNDPRHSEYDNDPRVDILWLTPISKLIAEKLGHK